MAKSQKKFKINGKKYNAVPIQDTDTVVGELYAASSQPEKTQKISMRFDDAIPVSDPSSGHSKLWKDSGYGMPASDGQIIRILKRRYLLLLLPLLAALAVLFIALSLLTHQNVPQNTIDYLGDKTGLVPSNKNVTGEITGYTAFESIPDQTWKAGATTQPMLLKNLQDNPVDLSPKVYLDLNRDGAFEEDECVWETTGRIAPGHEIDSIDLNRSLDAGNYNAEVVYYAYMQGTDTQANGMNFDFHVTIQ